MTTHRLVRAVPPPVVPVLDADQRRVVEHAGGPLLVLAGPGTGKTTTLVEAIVERIEGRGASAEQVLALTFSRKAAEQLRDRIVTRLGVTTSTNLSATFHSFAYGLIREFRDADDQDLYDAPLRLLSAPEADLVIAELLADSPESVSWPESLRRAAGTRGFAREVGAVLARAREKGLDEHALTALGREHGIEEFVAAGWFLDQYLANLDQQSATDYADLIRRAVILAEEHRATLRARYRYVFVDEYQDTDPGQVALLRALAGDGGDLVVVGDPYQSIYGFRGAEVRGILDFPADFPRSDGSPADVAVLRTSRRFGSRILTGVQRVAARIPLSGSIPYDVRTAFLTPQTPPDAPDGRVEVITYDTERAEVERIADLLRRAHLEDGIGWSEMAVLVRSGRASIPALRRGLVAAGVPVEVAADEIPLSREPAVQPLLEALRAAIQLDVTDPAEPGYLDGARAEGLLTSPLAGLDATDVRALARALRAVERAVATTDGRPVRSSPELLRSALVDPSLLDGIEVPAAERARRLAVLIHRARDLADEGATVEEVLWAIWSGTGWPGQLRGATERGGAAARLAQRDLDAICSLFDYAARTEEQRGHASVRSFLDTVAGQEIPAQTLAEKGVRGDAVRLLTAHRSKGLEWRLVVVAHVQEDTWPDLRRRATLLQAGRIGASRYGDGVIQPDTTPRELLAEERRLFYVACTRATERLVVTAVKSPDEEGEQPSRFLLELRGEQPEHRSGRPPRPLSLDGVVSELRRAAADPATSPALREAAVRRLAKLACERDGDRSLVPAADPSSWWGTRARSLSEQPIRPAEHPITLTASALAGLSDCPAKWFLEKEAGGASKSSQSQGFGNVVHAVADRIARGDLDATPDTVNALMEYVDRVWDQLAFRTPWSRDRERAEVEKALTRFVAWHHRPGARTVLATERELRAEVSLPDGQRVVLHGYADRLELDDDGKVIVVDLKTGKYPPPDKEVAENPQLGLYQYAVAAGAIDELAPDAEAGGAELWQLRKDVRGNLKIQRQEPQQPGEDGMLPVERQLAAAVELVRSERFEARPGAACERCAFTAMCPAKNAGTVLS